MTQNTSHAVMAQRSEPHDSLDDFPTPPWAARALCEHLISAKSGDTVWEPACNRGYLVKGLGDYFETIIVSDVHDYGTGHGVYDFLWPDPNKYNYQWIITNPPFRLAEDFIRKAQEHATVGIAMLVRAQFLESVGRFDRLFSQNPPTLIGQFAERVPMVKGRIDASISTATAYCWLVWFKAIEQEFPHYIWIPPCRRQLEREGDYDQV